MTDSLNIRWEEVDGGKVTRATYAGPCGSPMSASFTGWIDAGAVRRELERCRRVAATVPMVTS